MVHAEHGHNYCKQFWQPFHHCVGDGYWHRFCHWHRLGCQHSHSHRHAVVICDAFSISHAYRYGNTTANAVANRDAGSHAEPHAIWGWHSSGHASCNRYQHCNVFRQPVHYRRSHRHANAVCVVAPNAVSVWDRAHDCIRELEHYSQLDSKREPDTVSCRDEHAVVF